MTETEASLRRLAMLVADGAAPETVFDAVTKEAWQHFGSGTARMIRFEFDGAATLLANAGQPVPQVKVGEAWRGYPADGITATVQRTGAPARIDDYRAVAGAEPFVREGLRCSVGMPIHVNGQLWGMIAVASTQGPLPADTEIRMAAFTDLLSTAIATAHNRAELIASRARLVAAADDARRRITRDLHDGAQQRLIALALKLRMAADQFSDDAAARESLHSAAADTLEIIDELREIANGIHPSGLSEAGLGSALRTLGRRSAIPAEVAVSFTDRLPAPIEVCAYYVASEMLNNAAKHSGASFVEVRADLDADWLHLSVRDDGIGGADPTGSGITGLRDRVDAHGGVFALESDSGRGTLGVCRLPTKNPSERSW